MTEVLSKVDVDYLLNSIDSINKEVEVEGVGSIDSATKLIEKRLKLYDFRRPDRFSKDQIRTIEIMHETFSRLVTNNLSTLLRTPVDVRVQSVTQITYEEFVKILPNPTLFSILDMQPLSGSAILEINPSVTFSVVDRLLGGNGNIVLNRELTEIEQSISESIVEGMLGFLREAWRRIINLRLHLMQIETNPQLAQVIPPSEMMLMIMFNCRVNNVDGLINIAIPYITIEPIMSKLSAHTWYAAETHGKDVVAQEKLLENLKEIKVDVSAVLGKLDMSVSDIISLEEDDVILFNDMKYSDTISVFVEKKEKFKAIPGKMGNKKAVKIVEVLDSEIEDIVSPERNMYYKRRR